MGKVKATSGQDKAGSIEKAKNHKDIKIAAGNAKSESLVVKKAKVSSEIDELFSSVSSKKSSKKSLKPEDEIQPSHNKLKHRSSKENTYGVMKSTYGGDIVNPEAPLERIDAESGLPVYKAHLLKVGEGGGTPLCPFDCDCCF